MARGVVNWHIGRCGSSVLGALLAQHPSVVYSNEIYSRYMPRRRGSSDLPSLASVLEQAELPLSRDALHFFEVKHLPEQNLGLYPGLNVNDWLSLFFLKGYDKHILLTRRNGLRRIISHLRAARSGQYVLFNSSPRQNGLVEVPLEGIVHGFGCRTLLGWLEEYERGHAAVKKCLTTFQEMHPDFSWLELVYEDHIEANPREAYQDVCSFLGLYEFEVDLHHQKFSPGGMTGLISNFEEVKHCLSPTRFAWMLSD